MGIGYDLRIMWPLEYIELKHIENLLICGICYEYMETTVTTSCSHNYCSLCIRKYLHYKTQCPACFAETFEKDLRKNKILDEIILHFSNVKEKLKKSLRAHAQNVQSNRDGSLLCATKAIDKAKTNTPLSKEKNKVDNSLVTLKEDSSPCASIRKDMSSPSTSGNSKIALIFTPKRNKYPNASNIEDTAVVICPVCKVTVSETNINRHLDDCLKREAIKNKPAMTQSNRNPLPKLVFSLMKDVVIRKKLKELGLSSQGERKVLEARLHRYTVLYNAECDKLNPRPVSELLRQCEDEENLERNINKTSTFINRLQVNRNTEENIINNERKKYLEANKDSFTNLIKQIKSTVTPKKSSTRRSILNHSIHSEEDVPLECQAIAENSNDSIESETNDFRPINYDDIFIPESDSDTSCPLQTYSSIDPLKCITAEISTNVEVLKSIKSTADGKTETSQKQLKSFHSSAIQVQTDDTLSDHDKVLQSRTGNASPNHELNYDSTESCFGSPKSETRFQRRRKISGKGESKGIVSESSMADSKARKISQQEELHDKQIKTQILQDFLGDDISSNDSSDFRSYYGKSRTPIPGSLNDNTQITSFLEKENISSSPECGNNRSVRKRSRDFTSNKTAINANVSEMRKSSNVCPSETEESNRDDCASGVLNDYENGRIPKKLRLRKTHNINTIAEENIVVTRKSSRTRFQKK